VKRDIKRRLIVVSRGEDQIFRGVLKAADEWPPATAVMFDRRVSERRVSLLRVILDRRQGQRRRPPDAVWYSHRFIVVEVGVFPPQAVVLSWPGSPEGQ
jgi:hypothetical protein